MKQRSAVDLFHWKCWNKVTLGIYFVQTADKSYASEFIWNKEELCIYFIGNAEIKYHRGILLLKLLIKFTAVNFWKERCASDLLHWKCWNKVPLGIYFLETFDKRYGCEFIWNKEKLWIYFIENAEIKYHYGFILLKLLKKGTAVSLFKTKKSAGFISF